jgi:hypothetical protein
MSWFGSLPSGARRPIIRICALRIYLLPESVDIDSGFNYLLPKI